MVNVKKQKLMKKKQLINKKKSAFERILIDFFGTSHKGAYFKYWGGINGAIHKKLNNWNPNDEDWFERNGLYYARSNNEIMLPESFFALAFNEEVSNSLWDSTKKFLTDIYEDVGLEIRFIDVDTYFYELFDVFKLFDEVKKYDLVFIKNMTLELHQLLVDFGISECIDYFFIFYTEEDSERLLEMNKEKLLHRQDDEVLTLDFDMEPKFLKENKIGFELYQNLTEWKKEVTAPTRNDPEYRKMKKRVRKRDSSTCACCGYHNTKETHHGLEVHHIYGYKDHLDYRTEDSNCIILCEKCHKQYHSLYGKINVNPVTFAYFIRDYHTYINKNIQTTLDSS